MQLYPNTQISQERPQTQTGAMEGTFLAEGGLTWTGKQRPNHFCLPATVFAHCPAPSPSLLPPSPRAHSPPPEKARSQRTPFPQKPMRLAPSPHSSSAEEDLPGALEQEGTKVNV
ncbi:unnamed protein product [Pipistrellus nathusii]|uniref:Uncharacterized protein n=1 Tax=Pipistrellus nathusii TaxID=59473 RepID=A0ABP0A6B2_PIPNA